MVVGRELTLKFLLDTHVLFWSLVDHEEMPPHFRRLLFTGDDRFFVSAVTGWEIATKVRIGKWPEAAVLLPGLTGQIHQAGFRIAPLSLAQAERGGSLVAEHKDPFDRLLAAQALELDLTVMTTDPVFARLGCAVAQQA
ncbi:MAG: PIN domain nuclease [Hyphomicrobium sp.]|nr:PIN domain nuclease [Hyphomicrobium sp.]